MLYSPELFVSELAYILPVTYTVAPEIGLQFISVTIPFIIPAETSFCCDANFKSPFVTS